MAVENIVRKWREIAIEPPEDADPPKFEVPYGMKAWKNKGNEFAVLAVHYSADPRKRNDDWYAFACKGLRPDQIESELELNFESKAGTKAFPYLEHNADLYRIDPPNPMPKNWKIIGGMDYGARNPTSFTFYAVDEFRRFWAYDEFYMPMNQLKGGLPEFCRWLKGHKDYSRMQYIVGDPKMFAKDQNIITKETNQQSFGTIMSIAELMMKEGIHKLQRGNNDRMAGLTRVQQLFDWRGDRTNTHPKLFIGKRCNKAWWELTNAMYRLDKGGEKNAEDDIVKRNDHCFVAGTLIETIDGQKPIENITNKDFVLTRNGYKKVIASGQSGIEKTILLKFSNGASIECTPEHRIFTIGRGFVHADELQYSDLCLESPSQQIVKKLFWMKWFIEDTLRQHTQALEDTLSVARNTLSAAKDIITGTCGLSIMGQFQTATTSTTKTETRLTTNYLTLSVYQKKITLRNTPKNSEKDTQLQNGWSAWRQLEKKQKNGTGQKREESGIENKLKLLLQICQWSKKYALFAQKTIKLKNMQQIIQSFVTKTVALDIIENTDSPKTAVYNLSVEGLPEYYANGILVHNCIDQLKYTLLSQDAPAEGGPIALPGRNTLKSIEDEIDEAYNLENRDPFACSFDDLDAHFH